jgi:hypothetical protein
MKVLKRTLLEMMAGGFIGFFVWSLVGQQAISMLFTSIGGSFNCQVDVLNGLSRFVRWQMYFAVIGAVVFAAGLALARRALAKRRSARAGATAVPVSPERGGVS